MFPADSTDQELMTCLQQDSPEAFRQIFDRYQGKLLLYGLSLVKNEGMAKDIVQETFIKLWINRNDLDPGGSLSGFLHTVARNMALNQIKRAGYDQDLKNRIWQAVQETQSRVAFEEQLHARESRRLIQQAIDRLSPRRRLIFILSRQEGNTHEAIALKLNISKNTVKNQMVTAMKEIRSYLDRHSDLAMCWLIMLL